LAVYISAIVIISSPLSFLYVRDFIISKEYQELCDIHQGVTVHNKFDSKSRVINFNRKQDSDLSIWRLLFENPEIRAIINVKKAHLVKQPGNYLLSASTPEDANCSEYNKYFKENHPNSFIGKQLKKYY